MIFKFLFTQLYRGITGEVHRLEYNPHTQYKFHRIMAFIWILISLGVVFAPALWSNSVGILIVLEVSLYANFATEFGSMSAALAAQEEENRDK